LSAAKSLRTLYDKNGKRKNLRRRTAIPPSTKLLGILADYVMTFNKKDRKKVLLMRAKLLRNKSGEETLNAMLQLNKLNLEICKASIKEKNPKITKKQIVKELNKIYWKNGRT